VVAIILFLMLWDGAGYNNIIPMLEQGRLPNLQSIIESGSFAKIEPMGKTVTIPEWTVRFTGLTYDQTKVFSNDQWELIPYSKTIMSKIQESGSKVGWFVSKPYLSVDFPLCGIFNHADKKKELSPVYRDIYTGIPITGEISRKWYMETLVQDAIDAIPELGSNFMLVVHVNPDTWGHRYGENSTEYLNEIERADRNLGVLMQSLPTDAGIMVMSDHGFNEGEFSHRDAPDAWLATNIPLNRDRGTSRDIALTILDYFGIKEWRDDPSQYRGRSLTDER
jgi:predicted AlkP superfamily pyrophosphatase or phosphodiesterase